MFLRPNQPNKKTNKLKIIKTKTKNVGGNNRRTKFHFMDGYLAPRLYRLGVSIPVTINTNHCFTITVYGNEG